MKSAEVVQDVARQGWQFAVQFQRKGEEALPIDRRKLATVDNPADEAGDKRIKAHELRRINVAVLGEWPSTRVGPIQVSFPELGK